MPTNHQTVHACPGCSGTAFRTRGEPAAGFVTRVGDGELPHPVYTINECGDCGLFFKSDVLSAAALDRLYAELDHTPYDHEALLPTDRIVLAALRGLRPGARVLDFGCSTGRLLAQLPATMERLGVEINAGAAATARSRGIKLVAQASLVPEYRGKLDAIVCTDVYEHVARPTEFLAEMRALLARDGLLVLVTGNASAIPRNVRLAEFWYFRLPSHLQMASEKHLQWLASQLELELASLRRSCHYDLSPATIARQHVQSFAYHAFRCDSSSLRAKLLRRVPIVRRAEHWPNAPALNCTADHVVVVYRNASRI